MPDQSERDFANAFTDNGVGDQHATIPLGRTLGIRVEPTPHGGEPPLDIHDVLHHVLEMQADEPSEFLGLDPFVDEDDVRSVLNHREERVSRFRTSVYRA